MAATQEDKIKKEYFDGLKKASEDIEGKCCFTYDWIGEQVAHEDRSGTAIEHMLGMNLEGAQPMPGEDVLVFTDSYGYCKGILDMAPPGRINRKQIITKSPANLSQKEIKAILASGPFDLILFGCGIDDAPGNSLDEIHKHQDAITKLYFFILQELVNNRAITKRVACITCDVFAHEKEIHEECGPAITASASLFGVTNTARMETDLPIQFIDTEWCLADESVPWLSSEVFRLQTFGHNTVRILNSGRYVLRQMVSTPYEVPGKKFEMPDEGLIAITGGNGALAMVIGNWLLDMAQKQYVTNITVKFLSRSMKVSDQLMPQWKALQEKAESMGISIEQCKCDVSKLESVDEFISENTPNIVGFIHSAGVLQDSMMNNQTWEKFDQVFDAKSRAALRIHDAFERFENPNLKLFWLFSSTAVFGNLGQVNYSGSNAVLDAISRHRVAMGKPSLTIQWGAWGEAGMAANLDAASQARMRNSPMPPFSNKEGLHGLEVALSTGVPLCSVFKVNAQVMFTMIQGDQSITLQFMRNFTETFAPLPPVIQYDREKVYNVWKSYSGGGGGSLVFSHFMVPLLDKEEF